MKKTALIIVAHPDDETIWMGGMILTSKDIDWTIFSLCRGNDPVRAPRFKKACEYYGARSLISDLEDEGILNIEKSLPEIKKRVVDNFANKKFTYIFTHGYNGEYGHERHSAVHLAVKELVKEKILICEKLYFFSYQLEQTNISNSLPSDIVVELDGQTLAKKRNVLEKIYDLGEDYFEKNKFLREETFNLSDI